MARFCRYPEPWKAGTNLRSYERLLQTATTSNTNDIWPKCFTVAGTGGQTPYQTGGNTADYQCQTIMDAYRRQVNFQYKTGAELDAARYFFEALPVGGIKWLVFEDALGTPITTTDAVTSLGAAVAIDGIVTNPSGAQADDTPNPFGEGIGSLLLDSSTISNSSPASTFTFLIKGLAPIADQSIYSASAGAAPRGFIATVQVPGFSI